MRVPTQRRKRGMIAGQVVIYIMGIVVVMLVIIYGYKAIQGFRKQSEQIALVSFQKDLERSVERMAGEYGSVETKSFALPPGFEKLCLIDQSKARPSTRPAEMPGVVYALWDSSTEDNAFLVGKTVHPFFIGDSETRTPLFEIGSGYVCTKGAAGRITLRIEGVGNKAKIS